MVPLLTRSAFCVSRIFEFRTFLLFCSISTFPLEVNDLNICSTFFQVLLLMSLSSQLSTDWIPFIPMVLQPRQTSPTLTNKTETTSVHYKNPCFLLNQRWSNLLPQTCQIDGPSGPVTISDRTRSSGYTGPAWDQPRLCGGLSSGVGLLSFQGGLDVFITSVWRAVYWALVFSESLLLDLPFLPPAS